MESCFPNLPSGCSIVIPNDRPNQIHRQNKGKHPTENVLGEVVSRAVGFRPSSGGKVKGIRLYRRETV